MIRIRPFTDADEEKIIAWCGDEDTFYAWTFGLLGEYPLTKENFKIIKQNSGFVAVDDGEPVGYFIIRNPGGDLEELRFGYGIIDPKRRCEGIGKAMLSAGLKYAFDVYGAKRVTLGVYEKNRIGYNCYKAIGFRETGKVERYTVRGKEMCALEMEAIK